jgi:hypothetical protein
VPLRSPWPGSTEEGPRVGGARKQTSFSPFNDTLGSCPCVATGSTDSLHTHQNDSYKIFIQVFIGINRVIFFCIKYIQIIVN